MSVLFGALKWNWTLKRHGFFWPEEGQPQLWGECLTVRFAGHCVCHWRCVSRCLGDAGLAAIGCGRARCHPDAFLMGAPDKPLSELLEPQNVSCSWAPSPPPLKPIKGPKWNLEVLRFGVHSLSSLFYALVHFFLPFGYPGPYLFIYFVFHQNLGKGKAERGLTVCQAECRELSTGVGWRHPHFTGQRMGTLSC